MRRLVSKETYIDQLEIDFLEKLLCLWLFPDLKAERDVRRLQNIAPEAAHSDVLMLFFLYELGGKKDLHGSWECSLRRFCLGFCSLSIAIQTLGHSHATTCTLSGECKELLASSTFRSPSRTCSFGDRSVP